MTSHTSLDTLLDEIGNLPHDAQTELVERLLNMRAEQLGIFASDDDELRAPNESAC